MCGYNAKLSNDSNSFFFIIYNMIFFEKENSKIKYVGTSWNDNFNQHTKKDKKCPEKSLLVQQQDTKLK